MQTAAKDIQSIVKVINTANQYHELELLHTVEKTMPGSITYDIKRYRKLSQWAIDDTGILEYNYAKNSTTQNTLQLKFCVAGNIFCKKTLADCSFCKVNRKHNCSEKIDTIEVLNFIFTPSYLLQFAKANKNNTTLADDVIGFTHALSFSKVLPLCSRMRLVIEAMLNHNFTDSSANIFVNAQMQMLLLYSMDCMLADKTNVNFGCKFLANEADRAKIIMAREVLLQHISEPITIKLLSKKVGINECYLKKGFKEIFGTTIFEFYQSQRMEHAKYLLYEKGLSVTDVSAILGYSSISHFSTAFKKQTGIKPCELLLR